MRSFSQSFISAFFFLTVTFPCNRSVFVTPYYILILSCHGNFIRYVGYNNKVITNTRYSSSEGHQSRLYCLSSLYTVKDDMHTYSVLFCIVRISWLGRRFSTLLVSPLLLPRSLRHNYSPFLLLTDLYDNSNRQTEQHQRQGTVFTIQTYHLIRERRRKIKGKNYKAAGSNGHDWLD